MYFGGEEVGGGGFCWGNPFGYASVVVIFFFIVLRLKSFPVPGYFGFFVTFFAKLNVEKEGDSGAKIRPLFPPLPPFFIFSEK